MIDCMGCEYAPMDISDGDKPCFSCKATSSGLKSRVDVESLAKRQAYDEMQKKRDAIGKARKKTQMQALKQIYTFEELAELLFEFSAFDVESEDDGCPLRKIPYECPYGIRETREDATKFYKDYCKTSRESGSKFQEMYEKYSLGWADKRAKAILRKWEKAFDKLPVKEKGE